VKVIFAHLASKSGKNMTMLDITAVLADVKKLS